MSKSIAVLTSGGDAQGMNAAVRAVVRTGLDQGLEVYAIYEGYQGLIDGGEKIRQMEWDSVGGILHRGGTKIGSARCEQFRTREGRQLAVLHLVERGINNLIVIGGDGSLTGAVVFKSEWQEHITELLKKGAISSSDAKLHKSIHIVGLTGSIDNDMFGTDMTIGADTALHRITEAIDAITSTASSHQRAFVIEVMGRNCGYLALMGALASGAEYVLIPEFPPEEEDWETAMCDLLRKGRKNGRRESVVVVAEGAKDRAGNKITSSYIKEVLEDKLGEDTRVTILGHVQRGGAPSAFDRNLGTLLGHAAVETILSGDEQEPQLMGMRGNRVVHSQLSHCVEKSHEIVEDIKLGNYASAMKKRGKSFVDTWETFNTLIRTQPKSNAKVKKKLRFAVMHSGAPAPGMNTAVRTGLRIGMDKGHTILGVNNGFEGLIEGDITEMDWMTVDGWALRGGAELGTNRKLPEGKDFYLISQTLEKHKIDGLLMIGGYSGYQGISTLFDERESYPGFNIPMVCIPSTIDNDLPGSELSIGADSALNNIVGAVDKIKQSAVASRRCFVVEVMGEYCGYLALMSGMACGAERVYLHEDGITLQDLQTDLDYLVAGFTGGKRLGLIIRNERAHDVFPIDFMVRLFEAEGGDLFDVRQAILGHLQQGGNPSPFDRIQATRLTTKAIDYLIEESQKRNPQSVFMGMHEGEINFTRIDDFSRMVEKKYRRPLDQWWMDLRQIARVMAKPAPKV